MKIKVATSNPMKIEATKRAFAAFFRNVRIVGVPIPSSVSPQPISFGEIVRGARSRARRAFADCDYSVGIEAGIFRVASLTPVPFQMTMAAVFDGERDALGAGPFYEVPDRLVREVVKADEGSVSLVTRGKVTRSQVTRDAVLMALAPFVSPELYGRGASQV